MKTYQELIEKAKLLKQERLFDTNNYYESHHIIPKCENGDDSDENLVILTVPEHVEAHYLRAVEFEQINKRVYYQNILSANFIINIGKKSNCKKEEIENFLNDINKQQIVIDLKLRQLKTLSETQKGVSKNKIWVTDGQKNLYLDSTENIPEGFQRGRYKQSGLIKYSEQTKQLLKGKIGTGVYIHKNNQVKRIKKEELEIYLQQGWIKGSIDKRKNKSGRSNASKMIWCNNGKESRMFESIPEGWTKGRLLSQEQKQNYGRKSGFFWITNGINSKTIKLDEQIPEGWRKGRIQ